jgi:Ca2+-transporting ATPase
LTDGLLGLGLGVEPADKSIMRLPPRPKMAPFFSRDIVRDVLLIGLFVGVVALAVGFLYYDPLQPEDRTWQTMIFTLIAFMQIGQALASRSNLLSFFEIGIFSNPTLLIMVLATFALQLVAIYVPFFDDFFQITPLSAVQLLICIGAGALTFGLIELQKRLMSHSS